MEKAITEAYAVVMLEKPIDYDLLQKWKKRALLLRGFPRFIRHVGKEENANELFENCKVASYVKTKKAIGFKSLRLNCSDNMKMRSINYC